ncbi:MAG: PKD domain-containing protein, partial [Bacteroidia bacterium]|nr:PKD domain-containing protein [Bacteroidia bacterium]
MKKLFTLIILVFISIEINAQGEASNWYFGNGAGLIFDINTGTVTADNSAINTINTTEGCSSISDPNGILLFYTDGRNVWDANHQIMPNGDYNAGLGLLGDPSSTSSAVIVPKPGNTDQYYIFTVDEPHHNNSWAYPNQGPANSAGTPLAQYDDNNGFGGSVPAVDDGFNNGFNYTLVDLTLNGGMGDVVSTEKNVHLETYDPSDENQISYKCAEKITAVEHADGQSYWVITQFIDTVYAFRVDSSGVNTTPVTTQIAPNISTSGYRRNAIGYMKSSPDGSKIAVCHNQNGTVEGSAQNNSGSFWLYDFDNATGTVNNEQGLLLSTTAYGADFSADSNKLYVSNSTRIIQFDLEASNIAASQTIVHQQSNFLGAIQLGPDGKIYICNTASSNTLDVINAPNELGVACDYQTSGIALSLGTNATLGLPPFIQSFLIAVIESENVCFGDATQFTIDSSETYDSILWDFGDSNTSIDDSPIHTYGAPGTYTVSATLTAGSEVRTFNSTVTIFEVPVANQANDIDVCDDNNDGFSSFNFS